MNKKVTLIMMVPFVQGRMGFGACPDLNLPESFDQSSLVGQWYEMKRDSIFTWEMQQECSTQEYKLNDDGNLDLTLRANFWGAGFTYQSVDGKLKCENSPACKISVANGDEVNWTILA